MRSGTRRAAFPSILRVMLRDFAAQIRKRNIHDPQAIPNRPPLPKNKGLRSRDWRTDGGKSSALRGPYCLVESSRAYEGDLSPDDSGYVLSRLWSQRSDSKGLSVHNVLMELHGERSGGSPAIAGVSKGEADRTMEIFHE